MELSELVSFGERLSRDLHVAAMRYHVKSDQHDILGYEAGTVDLYLAWLLRGEPVPEDFRESTLLGEWGRRYSWDDVELLHRTAEFYRHVEERDPALRVRRWL